MLEIANASMAAAVTKPEEPTTNPENINKIFLPLN